MLTTITSFNNAKISEYNNVEILDLTYQNFFTELPNEVFSLPKLHTIAFGNEQMNAEKWAKFVLQISQNAQIKHLHLACFPHFPTDITPIKQLVSLKLGRETRYSGETYNPNKGISFEKFTKQLSQLPDLEKLSIDLGSSQGDNISSAGFDAIADIKSLQTLKISVREMENFHFGKLKNIKNLELCTTSNRLSDDINEMTNLEELHLQDVRLTNLHLTKELKNLHTITFNFSWKRQLKSFVDVSDDFFRLLPQIKCLKINDLPKSGNTKVLTDLHEIFQQTYAQNLQKSTLIADIITKNDTDKYAMEDLLDILHIKKAQIDNLTWTIVEKRLEKEILVSLENVKTYFLLGKSTKSLDLRKILKSLGWKATKNSENADCIVVSRGCEAGANVHFDAKKAVSDTYLFAWAEEKTGVERFDEGMNTNLVLLLKSEQPDNQSLGIDLLTNAYTSTKEIDACLLAIALFTTDKNLREKTKKFIEKNLSSNLLTQYKKHNRRGHEKETYEIIKNLPEIDTLSFSEVAFLGVRNKYNWERFGFTDIIQLGGEMMPLAIKSLQYYSWSIEIPLEITKIHPDFITHFPAEYTSVLCHNASPEVQKMLFKLTTPKEIRFDYFREDYLHEDIGNMQCLEKIQFNVLNLINFPQTLSKLTQIKSVEFYNEEITTIPAPLSSWTNLENLKIFGKKFVAFPDWISNFQHIKKIELFYMDNSIALDTIFELQSLEILDIRVKEIILDLPHKTLKNLKNINIEMRNDTVTKTENDINNVSLKTKTLFELSEKIIDICPSDLQEFQFSSVQLNAISDKLSKFTKLKKLSLVGSFEQIPACIADLPLETLCLKSNKIIELPEFVGDMPTLKTIELSRNLKNQKKKLQKKMPHITFWI